MRAKITKADGYRCAPDGHTVIVIPMGAIVEGRVAQWALDAKAASRMFEPVKDRKVVAPAETKRRRKK